MKRFIVGSAVAGSLFLTMGSMASAGEITGNGKTTPIKDYRASSICSFSGLNDDPAEPGLFADGRVQSFGDIVQEAIVVFGDGKGASSLVGLITGEGPGASCRGNIVHEE